ncbi:MAG: hypothetical protein MK105_11490 [Crocinitomicaceae bacterium]|nr:hypothetical protein [Crocinitomicaceae bacterium]
MKKIFLLVIMVAAFTNVNAQSQEVISERLTMDNIVSLEPADGKPMVFITKEELNYVPGYILAVKKDILRLQDNKEVVLDLRKQLWRYENAEVLK